MEAVSDALGIIFTESYISLAALLAMFLMAFGFASAGGVGASSAPAGSTVAKFAKDQDSVRSRLALRCGLICKIGHVRCQKHLPYSWKHPLLSCMPTFVIRAASLTKSSAARLKALQWRYNCYIIYSCIQQKTNCGKSVVGLQNFCSNRHLLKNACRQYTTHPT